MEGFRKDQRVKFIAPTALAAASSTRGHVGSTLLPDPRPRLTGDVVNMGARSERKRSSSDRSDSASCVGPGMRQWLPKELVHADCVYGWCGTWRVSLLP